MVISLSDIQPYLVPGILFVVALGILFWRVRVLEVRVNACSTWRDTHDRESGEIRSDLAALTTEVAHCAKKEDIAELRGWLDGKLGLERHDKS